MCFYARNRPICEISESSNGFFNDFYAQIGICYFRAMLLN